MSLLSGGRVLLTGASGGLGHAIARALAERGAKLVLTGRRVDQLEQLAAETGGKAIAADIDVPDEVERLLGQAGEIDVLVANAGLSLSGALEDFSAAEIDKGLAVNLGAPMQLTRSLLPEMLRKRRGHLVYMSSLGGQATTPLSSLYCATKFGLRGFALALREDLHGSGVGVSLVSPGPIRDAGMFHASGAERKLPPGFGTRPSTEVGDAVVKAVETGRAEIGVGPPAMRIGAKFALLLPGANAFVNRIGGAREIAEKVAAVNRERI